MTTRTPNPLKVFCESAVLLTIIVLVVISAFGLRGELRTKYDMAITSIANGEYDTAIELLEYIGHDYQDSNFYMEFARDCSSYEEATLAMMAGQYEKALTEFILLEDFYDSSLKASKCLQKLKE